MSGTYKLEYILMAEMQKTELYPDKDHWKLEYLKQAAGDLAELQADRVQAQKDLDEAKKVISRMIELLEYSE
jgi:hypothetical protein